METSKTKLGADHPDTLTSMANLAFTWKSTGQHGKAIDMLRTCVLKQQGSPCSPARSGQSSTRRPVAARRRPSSSTRPKANRAAGKTRCCSPVRRISSWTAPRWSPRRWARPDIVVGVADDGIGIASLLDALHERRMPVSPAWSTVPHRFISGEGGALIRGINGEIPIPPGQRVAHSSDSGVGGLPTLLSNAETFAQLAIAARLGPDAFADIGVVGEPGTLLLTVGGSAGRPTSLKPRPACRYSDILARCQAPVGPAVLVGGYHGSWIAAADALR